MKRGLALSLSLLLVACGEEAPNPRPTPSEGPVGQDERGAEVPPEARLGEEVPGSATPLWKRRDIDWASMDPLEYLEALARHPDGAFSVVVPPPEAWIRREHVESLMGRIRDRTPASVVVSVASSYAPFDRVSTVGNEAMFLVQAWRDGVRYPPRLCSVHYFDPDPDEFEDWWKEARKH